MKVQRVTSAGLESPSPVATKLPARIVNRAVRGLCWVSLLTAVSCVVLTTIQKTLQPEFAKAWEHPLLRIASLGVTFLSLGFLVVQRKGLLRKERLLDLGLVFQVAVAFTIALFEGAVYDDPNRVVVGHSGIAVWMMACGFLMPTVPARAALAAALCVAAFPAAYWVDLQIFGFEPMPMNRMMVWLLPLAIVGVWMCILNNKVLSAYVREERAEDIGSYVLDSRLGAGGMGDVWRAKHKMLARDAAIKLIRPEVLNASTGKQEDVLRKRFEREAQATASLRSPHTVELYDFGTAKDGSFYYAMELLEGIDLQQLVEKHGPLEPERVIHILKGVCNSLEEAHRAGLVHRDIKPRNILLCRLGLEYDFAKVLDFGLVKSQKLDDRGESTLTTDGLATGTPAYLPPEIALGKLDVDGRSDLYSLGCVAYFMLTGHMVFEEASATAFAIAHVQKPAPPMSERSELPIPSELEAIVMQLLEKDPASRIQSARELERRLRGVREVPMWCPDRAARWWETNLPHLAAVEAAQLDSPLPECAAQGALQDTHA
jgi:serine/threonine-protein kinase